MSELAQAFLQNAHSIPDDIGEIAIIGGGNWGTAVARKIAHNLLNSPNSAHHTKQVTLWIYEEYINGESLVDIINTTHTNVKYLPNIILPPNIVATSNLEEACLNKSILLFVIPHQFLKNILRSMKSFMRPTIEGEGINKEVICVSLIKGVEAVKAENGIGYLFKRYTEIINEELGVKHTVAVMGANVANDVAKDHFAEATLASTYLPYAKRVASLFHCASFRTELSEDVSTVEFCGALKNVVAVGAGFVDGLNLGQNAKAAVIRQGLEEMAQFCQIFDNTGKFTSQTLFKSCGVADLIATSYGGRNRKCAIEFVTRCQDTAYLSRHDGNVYQIWNEIERDLLDGQKLQGTSTAIEVNDYLASSKYIEAHPSHFPLFRVIYKIVMTGKHFDELFLWD